MKLENPKPVRNLKKSLFLSDKIMPKHVEISEEDLDAIIDDGNLSGATKKIRARMVGCLHQFLADQDDTDDLKLLVDKAINDEVDPLEKALLKFYSGLRVKNKEDELELPKLGTLDTYKSHLKMHLLDMSAGKVDVSNKAVFPRLEKFFAGNRKKLKAAGKADTDHTEGKILIYIQSLSWHFHRESCKHRQAR